MITSPTDHLLVEQDGHVVTVTMNRPDKRNAWSGDMIHGMAEVWDAIDDDDSVRVAILTGAGGNFCAGADLTAMSANRSSRATTGSRTRSPGRTSRSAGCCGRGA
jgi:enoyl-CoA hydratase